jgi:hypothetical protein
VIVYAPPFVRANVKPNALPDGGFENVNVEFPFAVLVKLFAVDKSTVTEPPVPKFEYVSL